MGAIFGAIMGSFIGALVTRWPRAISLSSGRSQCDACQYKLRVADLIPIFSVLLLRGKCRHCGNKIDPIHQISEMSAMIIGGLSFMTLPIFDAFWFALFAWILLPLIILDARHLWLPNLLILILAIAGMIRLFFLGDTHFILVNILFAAASFAILEGIRMAYKIIYGRHGMGGGDPKLIGAIMLWLPMLYLPYLLFLSSGLGILWAIYANRSDVKNKGAKAVILHIPFGSFLAAAAIFLLYIYNIGY
ncbi:hypothetical protein LPB140_03175 [Sphingorhabdus lutea]|uniref:Prepilin leader peptidase/N-methyltransferase n=2 Tax=Sphingorhabdus lutea TaxID=1913578 RepID=A0A1L3JEH6_9SPHN|nr:hypothetical protein LPB140_03175 [Sphingorhabdus lutea]